MRVISIPNEQTWWKDDHFNTVFISGMLKIEMIKMMLGSIKAWIKWQLTLCISRGWSLEECSSVNYNERTSQPLVIYIVYWLRCDQKHNTNILNKCCEDASSMAQASHHTKSELLYNRMKHSSNTCNREWENPLETWSDFFKWHDRKGYFTLINIIIKIAFKN